MGLTIFIENVSWFIQVHQLGNFSTKTSCILQASATDLKPDNIMARLEDPSCLEESAIDEFENPLPRKAYTDRSIYISRNQYGHYKNIAEVLGKVSITDFGYAVQGNGPHYGPIQVEPFRAPEVILNSGWSYSSDIWNLGVMVRLFYYPSVTTGR